MLLASSVTARPSIKMVPAPMLRAPVPKELLAYTPSVPALKVVPPV
jgi:hypothetical protein